jgi:hypothetical protein
LSAESSAESDSFFRIGRERRVEGVIDPARSVVAHFISKDDLAAAKLAAGRPQDIADLAAIRQAAERDPSQ